MSTQSLPVEDLKAWRQLHVPLYNEQKLKLGLFGINCSYGLTMSHAETSYEPTWAHTVKVARHAEALGFEFLVPIARWRGFGGTTDFNGVSFETYTWAAGIAASTERIMPFATSHVPTMHPIVAAKAAATIDHISGGRAGLNVVMGWFDPEMEMFGAKQREHDTRYQYGAEWISVVKRLWEQEEAFDFDGEFVSVKGAQAHPKPVQRPRPVIVNAGNSPAGIDFSAREVDFNFISPDVMENVGKLSANVRGQAADHGRDIGILAAAYVICRDTEEEAKRVYDDIIAKGDFKAAENIMDVLKIQSQSFDEQIRRFQERFVAGWGNYPLIGTPEQVVAEMQRFSDAGVDGLCLGFLDYDQEMTYFDDKVMPLLRQAGLRR